MKDWIKPIRDMGAGWEMLVAMGKYDSLNEFWQGCDRGDWMLWLAGRSGSPGPAQKKLASTACRCARLVRPHVRQGGGHLLKAVELVEAWAGGRDVKPGEMVGVINAAIAEVFINYAAMIFVGSAGMPGDDGSYYASAAIAMAAAVALADTAAKAGQYAGLVATNAADAAAAGASSTADNAVAARRDMLRMCAEVVRGEYPSM